MSTKKLSTPRVSLPYKMLPEDVRDAVSRLMVKCPDATNVELFINGQCTVGYVFTRNDRKMKYMWVPIVMAVPVPMQSAVDVLTFKQFLSRTEFKQNDAEGFLEIVPKWWTAETLNSRVLNVEKIPNILDYDLGVK
jgi:hypothetical protein